MKGLKSEISKLLASSFVLLTLLIDCPHSIFWFASFVSECMSEIPADESKPTDVLQATKHLMCSSN